MNFEEIDIFFAERVGNTEEEKLFLATLMAVSRQGHLCLCIEEDTITPLEQKVRAGAKESKFVCSFGNRWYLQRNWVLETRFLEQLKRLLKTPLPVGDCPLDSSLNEEQKEAIIQALTHSVSLISGGPGTGKSYLIKQLAASFPGRVLVAAPTGKAAAHLQCRTLHALLGIGSEPWNQEASVLFADLIIVDECSMIDVRLFTQLLASVQAGTRLVLIGDKDQLPPVEAGSLFADLEQVVPCTYLKKCMRSDRAEILDLAQAINRGDSSKITCLNLDAQQVVDYAKPFFSQPTDERPSQEQLLRQMQQFCILSCIRQGPLGVDTLNELIAECFLSRLEDGQWLALPILITRSDYRLNVYNGQTGILMRHAAEKDRIFIGEHSFLASLLFYEYAYALSVHKSQGSEYEHVLLLVPPGSEVFGREILYTAVTRARSKIEISGTLETIHEALKRSSRKISGLQARVGNELADYSMR